MRTGGVQCPANFKTCLSYLKTCIMFYLDIPSTGHMTKFRTAAVAWQQFHATPLECDLYQGEEVIAEKYHIPIQGADGDEYILETHIIEQDAEYVEL